MHNNVIHNIYIDHVDKSSNDSGYHHHHLAAKDGHNNLNIIYHNDDECNNDLDTPITIHYGFGSNYLLYGPAKHTHDDDTDGNIALDIIDTSRLRSPERRAVNILTSTALNINNDYNVEWSGNDDNVTGGYPNRHDPT